MPAGCWPVLSHGPCLWAQGVSGRMGEEGGHPVKVSRWRRGWAGGQGSLKPPAPRLAQTARWAYTFCHPAEQGCPPPRTLGCPTPSSHCPGWKRSVPASPHHLDEAGSGPGVGHIGPHVFLLGPRAVCPRSAAGVEVTRPWALARALPENGAAWPAPSVSQPKTCLCTRPAPHPLCCVTVQLGTGVCRSLCLLRGQDCFLPDCGQHTVWGRKSCCPWSAVAS